MKPNFMKIWNLHSKLMASAKGLFFNGNLTSTLDNYTSSWEGYKSTKGDRYDNLQHVLQNSTIREILNQYNSLSFSKLWNGPLGELFTEEITERILSDATFTIMTVWRSIKQWSQQPFVSLHIGFEEGYDILDNEGESVIEDDPGASYTTVSNDQLPEETQRDIIKNLIRDANINATLRFNADNVWITRIGNFDLQTVEPLSTEITIPVTIYQSPDLHLLYLMLENIKKKTYEIINTTKAFDEELRIWFEGEESGVDGSNSFKIIEAVVALPSVEELINKVKDKPQYAGLWDKIHMTALKSTTPESFRRFSIWIWDVCKNLPCSDCKYHMLQYILANAPQDCIPSEEARHHVAFYWSWKFHNAVNVRIDKPEVEYDVAFEYYSNIL